MDHHDDAQRVSLFLGYQAVLSLVRAFLLYAHRNDAANLFSTLPLEPSFPDYHIPDAVIAAFMAFACLSLAIRVRHRPTAPIIAVIVVEFLLCFSLIAEIVIARPAYIDVPDAQKLIEVILVRYGTPFVFGRRAPQKDEITALRNQIVFVA